MRIESVRWLLGLLFLVPLLTLAEPIYLVDSDWLAEHIDDDGLLVLEVRYHPHRYFTLGHIPGAVQVQRFKDLGDNQANPLMRFPSREAFQASLRHWGVNDDSTLVLYDDSNTALVSRLYYLLELYGFDMQRVKILNGGAVEWSAFEEMTKEPTPPRAPGKVTLEPVYWGNASPTDPLVVNGTNRPLPRVRCARDQEKTRVQTACSYPG